MRFFQGVRRSAKTGIESCSSFDAFTSVGRKTATTSRRIKVLWPRQGHRSGVCFLNASERMVPHKGRRWALKSLGNFCSARLNWHSRSRAGLITAFFGGEPSVRFRALRWRKRPFVHEACDGSYAPQLRPFAGQSGVPESSQVRAGGLSGRRTVGVKLS